MYRMLTLSYEIAAPIGAFLIAAFTDAANSNKIGPAGSAAAALVGTTTSVGASTVGQMGDVEVIGLNRVTLGGAVAARDPLTSDANAKAIKATVAGQKIIGFANQPGVAGDIINYLGAPGVLGSV